VQRYRQDMWVNRSFIEMKNHDVRNTDSAVQKTYVTKVDPLLGSSAKALNF